MPHRNLFLLRHAQAFAPELQSKDTYRLLTEAGWNAAATLGAYWCKQGMHFDKIRASPAVRTISTAKLVAGHMGYAHEAIGLDDVLYEGTVGAVIAQMQTWNAAWQRVLIVSHKPLISALITYLTGKATLQLPTCGYTHVRLNIISWHEVAKGVGQIVASNNPEEL